MAYAEAGLNPAFENKVEENEYIREQKHHQIMEWSKRGKRKETKNALVESITGLVEDAINLTEKWESNQAKFSRMSNRVKETRPSICRLC